MVEAGTYIRNMGPKMIPIQEKRLLGKYRSIIEDIEDEHFESDQGLQEIMLKGCFSTKREISGASLRRKLKVEMTALKTFASKFPGINCVSDLPSGSTQLCHVKKPLILKLWKAANPATVSFLLLVLFLYNCTQFPTVTITTMSTVWAEIPPTWWL
jgi:hypothetical protein